MEKNPNKIWFLQVVRVLACLSVVYTHWYGILAVPNNIASFILQAPMPDYPIKSLTDYVGLLAGYLRIPHLATAYFGLGLFFVLSGYVIPLSLKNTTPKDYLLRRLFRIYPSLIVCTILAMATMLLANYFLGHPPHRSLLNFKVIVGNLTLTRDFFATAFVDNVTWSLEIEMHFYLLFFLYFYFDVEKKCLTFISSTLILLFLAKIIPPHSEKFGSILDLNTCYLSFMFVGTAIYYTSSRQWSLYQGFLVASLLLIMNFISLKTSTIHAINGELVFINHLHALIIFLALLITNRWLPYSKVINRIAEVSYPLYLIHGFTGYTFYFVFFHLTKNPVYAAALAFAAVLVLTRFVHHNIEKPAIQLSKGIISKRYPLPLATTKTAEN